LDFHTAVRAHACLNSNLATAKRRYPAVLFSHGLGETRYSYVSILEDLASHGFIVVAIDHTYSNRMTVFPDGREARWDDYRWNESNPERLNIAINENFREWTADNGSC
jgi:predicted dienelactone hydrolase